MGIVANLAVKISANLSDFEKGVGSLERSLDKTGGKLQTVGSRLTTGITLPLVGAAVAATKFASDFERSTTKLVTLSGVSEQQMRTMRQAVLDMAPAVGIGPRALSEALLVVTSTGFQGAAAMQVLELSAKASAVGMGDTTSIARALTSAVNAYGSENLTAAAAADILHATVVAGGAEATELAGELGRVVGVASQLGVKFDEVGAFIATYTRLGLSAAEATTGLSGVLNTILSPSQEARKALAEIGVSAESLRSSVSDQGLGSALTGLLGKLHGNADATAAVFGNVRALAGVMGTAGSQAAQYASVLEQIKGSTGGLNRAFEETKKTFAFQWDQFKAQAERAAITLGTQLLPAMSNILQAARPLGEMIVGLIGWFSSLPQPIQTGVLGFLAIAAAMGPVTYAIGSLMTTGSALLGFFRMTGLMSALARTGLLEFGAAGASIPVAPIVAAVAAIGASFALLIPRIRAAINEIGVWNTLKGMAAGTLAFGAGGSGVFLSGFGSGATKREDINLPYEGPASGGVPAPGAFPPMGPIAPKKDPAAEQWKAFNDRISGKAAIDSATDWMKHLSQVGGLTKITDQATEELHKTLEEALDAYKRLGRVAPEAMNATWLATMKLPPITQGLGGQQFGEKVGPFGIPTPPLPVGVTQGLGGGLQLPNSIGPLGMPKQASFLQGTFGSMKDFGANLGIAFVDAVRSAKSLPDFFKTLGTNVAGSIGSALGNSLGKMASGMGGMLGGVLGSILPGIGSMLGPLVTGLFGKLFGPSEYEKRVRQEAADRKTLNQNMNVGELGRQSSYAGRGDLFDQLMRVRSTAAPEYIQSLMNQIEAAAAARKEAVPVVIEGINSRVRLFGEEIAKFSEQLRAKGLDPNSAEGAAFKTQFAAGQQGTFDNVSAMAVGGFGLAMKEGGGAMSAYAAIKPALDVLIPAQKEFNFEMSETTRRLLDIGATIEANKPAFAALEADGQIVGAMLKGNIADFDLFKAAASDISTQIGMITANGVPMSQALALNQPVIQSLWEAQQKFGFETDEATKAIIDQAVQQGLVGANMKDVNQKILDVLVLIGKALGADIPAALSGLPGAAQSAADGMNAAFSAVHGPSVGFSVSGGGTREDPLQVDTGDWESNHQSVPQMAAGGVVRARTGGTLVNVGEAGRDEAIVPLGQSRIGSGSGATATFIIEKDGHREAAFLLPYLVGETQRIVG